MNRRRLMPVMAAVTVLASVLAMPAFAQGAREGKMRVLGRGTVEAVPDLVRVQVGVSNKAASPTTALDQNSAVTRKIIDFSKGFGVDERDIQTASVNLAPTFKTVRDPNGTTRQEPDGYTASNMVRVKLTDVSKLGAFMRQVLDQGATNIAGVHFGLSNPEKFSDEARTKAVEDAMRQAQGLAQAARVKLGAIQDIAHPPRSQFRTMDSMAETPSRAAAKINVPVEAGSITIMSEVDITWAIE
jgi:uncharacterized protein YggE